jgi:hypothetical protein
MSRPDSRYVMHSAITQTREGRQTLALHARYLPDLDKEKKTIYMFFIT